MNVGCLLNTFFRGHIGQTGSELLLALSCGERACGSVSFWRGKGDAMLETEAAEYLGHNILLPGLAGVWGGKGRRETTPFLVDALPELPVPLWVKL